MRPTPKPEYTENEKLIWDRKVIVAGWCVLTGFIIALFIVTISFYLFG